MNHKNAKDERNTMKQSTLRSLALVLWATATCMAAQQRESVSDSRSVPQLIESLRGDLPMRRFRAAEALGKRGAEALPAIREAIGDDDWRVRRGGTDALAAMQEPDPKVIPRLIELLADDSPWVRDGAAAVLGKFGAEAESAAAGLAALCTDRESWIRNTAINALKSVTQDKDVLLPAAVALIRVPDTCWRARGAAVGLLGKHGQDSAPATAALFHLIDQPSEGMWCCIPSAVDVLLKLGTEPAKVEQAVLKLGRSDQWSYRRLAASLAVKHFAESDATLPFVKNLAENDPHRKVRAGAAQTLKQLQQQRTEE